MLLTVERSTLDDLPAWAIAMLETAPVAHLGLLDERDHPRVLPVTFALHGDALWSAIDDKSKRVAPGEVARLRYLRRRPRAVLTVDRYDDDWTRLAWVQALGEVEITDAGAAGTDTATVWNGYMDGAIQAGERAADEVLAR